MGFATKVVAVAALEALSPPFWPIIRVAIVASSRALPSHVLEKRRRWDETHEWGGKRVYGMVLDLSGYYVKAAQILASKTEFMPRQWTVRLAQLFDNMPARPWSQVQQSLRCQLGRSTLAQQRPDRVGIEDVFEWLSPLAMASASIGQVHVGRLSSWAAASLGQHWQQYPQVVVKVQHRDMERLMASDLCNVGRVARFLRGVLPFDVMPMVVEIQGTIPREFDFQREARLMDTIRHRLLESGSPVIVPRPIAHLCTARMLVMEQMTGMPFTQVLQRVGQDQELRQRAAAAVQQLLLAFGHMMLQDGLFQADPHPGNLMLQADGRLVLLDFGQCKALSAEQQRGLARLVLALAEEDPAAISACMAAAGMEFDAPEGGVPDQRHVVSMAYVMFDTRPSPEACMSPFVDNPLLTSTPITQLPAYLWLVLRSVMLLRGLCHALGMDVSAVRMWKPMAAQALHNPELEAQAQRNAQLDSSCVRWAKAAQGGQGSGRALISITADELDI